MINREGCGPAGRLPDAVFEAGDPEFRGEAQLLLPLLLPRPVRMNVTLDGSAGARVTLSVAGREIAVIHAGELIRGDNLLRLRTAPDQPLKLQRFEARFE